MTEGEKIAKAYSFLAQVISLLRKDTFSTILEDVTFLEIAEVDRELSDLQAACENRSKILHKVHENAKILKEVGVNPTPRHLP